MHGSDDQPVPGAEQRCGDKPSAPVPGEAQQHQADRRHSQSGGVKLAVVDAVEAEEDRAGCRDGTGKERRQQQSGGAQRHPHVVRQEGQRRAERGGPDADAEDGGKRREMKPREVGWGRGRFHVTGKRNAGAAGGRQRGPANLVGEAF